jgi:hypothetical protein
VIGLSLVLALVCVVALVVGVLAVRDGDGDGGGAGAPPSLAQTRPRPDLAATALQDLTDAVAAGETDPGDLAGDDPAEAAWARAVLDNARALHVRDFSARYVDEDPSLTASLPSGQWAAAVDTTWQFGGFDQRPSHTEVTFVFAVEDGRAVVVDAGGGARRTPLWLTGPLDVRTAPGTLVAVAGDTGARAYLAYAREAVTVVRRVLPGWRGKLVVEVPADADGLDTLLGAESGEYANIAAVTTTADGSVSADSPVHIFVNPQVFGGLKPRGAQVVMSHEATHVATDAATTRTPLWLLEGFADYVALRDLRLPLSVSAGQIISQVRQDGAPRHLPGSAEFDPQTTHLGAQYEAAWLACRLLAGAGGEDHLVNLYRRVSAGQPLDATLREEFGFGEAELTRRWRAELSAIAG